MHDVSYELTCEEKGGKTLQIISSYRSLGERNEMGSQDTVSFKGLNKKYNATAIGTE